MNGILRLIIGVVRAKLIELGETELNELTDHGLSHYLFCNYREIPLYGHGMRLTHGGQDILKDCFSSFVIELDGEWGPLDLLYLDRNCAFPYFIERKRIVLFDQLLAIRLRLNAGNLKQLRESAGMLLKR